MAGAKKVTLKKIVPKGDDFPHLRQIQDNVQQALDKMAAAQAQTLSFGGFIPIGSIVWIDISLPGVPVPPANFQKCDGSKISDARSPMAGQSVRDINVATNFIRGSTISGTVQAADAVVPAHPHSLNAHTHDLNSHVHAEASHLHAAGTLAMPNHVHELTNINAAGAHAAITVSNNNASNNATAGADRFTTFNPTSLPSITGSTQLTSPGNTAGPNVANTLGPSVANTATDGGSGAETRPKNISMVAYMRIW